MEEEILQRRLLGSEVLDRRAGVLDGGDDPSLAVGITDDGHGVVSDLRTVDPVDIADHVQRDVRGVSGDADEQPCAGVGGVAEPLDAVLGHQVPVTEDPDPVTDRLDLSEDVRGEEDGRAALGLGTDDLAHLLRAGGVEPGRGFVEDEQVGLSDQRHPEHEPLGHPLRVAAGLPVGRVRDPDPFEHRVGVPADLL